MAEKTEAHKKLIEEAKGLDIKSAHLFGEEKLKSLVAEAKSGSGGSGSPPDASDGDQNDTLDDNDRSNDTQDLGDGNNVTLKEVEGYLYHETEQPRVFKSGEEVPEGWAIENRKFWILGDYGVLVHVEG